MVNLVNRKSQAFKQLMPELEGMDAAAAAVLIGSNPRIMVRPILVAGKNLSVGFKEEEYRKLTGVK